MRRAPGAGFSFNPDSRQMRRTLPALVILVAVSVGYAPAGGGRAGSSPALAAQDTLVSYSRDVFPIIQDNCLRCHGGTDETGEVVMESGLDMTTYDKMMIGSEFGTVVEPGDLDNSLLVEMITTGDMPDEGDPLQPEQIELITRWIAQGAVNN